MRSELIRRSRRRTIGGVAVAAALIGLASPARALVCSVSPQSVSFGAYDPLAASPLDGVGNVNVSCDTVTAFTISLSAGAGSYGARSMTSGAEQMHYNLYRDASRVTIWGDGTGSTGTVSTTATGGDFTVYGRVPAGQNVSAGSYADTIMVTVTY